MSAGLIAFLRARLDEDKVRSAPGPEPDSWCDRADGLHFDHARVLAEVQAKRAILDRLEELNREVGDGASADPHDLGEGSGLWLAAEHLALPYADHEAYDESWRP